MEVPQEDTRLTMSRQEFEEWLDLLTLAFRRLDSDQRFRTMFGLMEECTTNERLRWQEGLTERLQRDMVGWLPVELACKILSYLDVKSLFR